MAGEVPFVARPRIHATWDGLLAALAGILAFGVYVRTLAPGLVAITDVPAFQFVGRVLGVVHHPGYPLYTLLTHPFSYLPIGSLAYRINLFSALMGAATVALIVLILRRLDVGPVVAFSVSLGLAFGSIFWSQAVIAEVYTLNSALIAGMLLALFIWEKTRRPGAFYAAIGLLALGLGHHTTIVLFVPGVVAYALLVDRSFALRARTLAITAGLLAAGMLQYAFILIRSRQPGAYLESYAPDLPSLLAVIAGRQFGDGLFAFDFRQTVFERLPLVLGQFVGAELTLPGTVLAIAGAVLLLRRRRAHALLLLGGIVGMLGFAVTYDAIDTEVFTIPALVGLWICAGVALQALVRSLSPLTGAAVTAAVLLLPAWQLVQNYTARDMSRDTEAAGYFEGLFEALPDRSVLVRGDFLVDRMVMYKLLGEGAAGSRQIVVQGVRPDALRELHAAGFSVFAFGQSASRLRHEGLDFSFAPHRVLGGSLADVLAGLPDGSLVALALPASRAAAFAAAPGTSLTAISAGSLGGRDQSNLVVLGARGSRQPALQRLSSHGAVSIQVEEHEAIAGGRSRAPGLIQVWAESGEAAIRLGGRGILRTTEGAAVALWNPDGTLRGAFVLDASNGFRVPALAGPLSVYRLRGEWPNQDLQAHWTSLHSRSGSFMLRVQPGHSIVLYAGRDAPLHPRVIDQSPGPLEFHLAAFSSSDGRRPETVAGDGAPSGSATGSAHVYRIEATVPRAAESAVSVTLALGGLPGGVIGRLTAPPAGKSPTRFYEVNTTGLLQIAGQSIDMLLMARTAQQQLLGTGWSAAEGDRAGPFRWMTAIEAELLLPLGSAGGDGIRLQAYRPDGDGGPRSLRLRVNGADLPERGVQTGWHWYEWSVPAGTLVAGTNEMAVIVDRLAPADGPGAERAGLAISRIAVSRPGLR